MIHVVSGNVLLKPSQRRQMMGWLKRTIRLGEKLGNFVLTLTLHRRGKGYEVRAHVRDSAGQLNATPARPTGAMRCGI